MTHDAHALSHAAHQSPDVVRLKRLGIDTYQEPVIFLARSSPVCRSEGWEAQSRIQVTCNDHSITATLNVTTDGLLGALQIVAGLWLHRRLGHSLAHA